MAEDEKKKTPTVEPAQLKRWASDAALLHTQRDIPLTEAVIDVLTGKDVTISHIKRVCEEANVKAFRILFKRGGKNRSVQFDGGPADPIAVVAELKDGYAAAPIQEDAMKTASTFDDVLEKLATNSNAPPIEKTAGVVKVAEPDSPTLLYDAIQAQTRNKIRAHHRFNDAVAKVAAVVRRESGSIRDELLLGVVKEAAAREGGEYLAAVVLDKLVDMLGMDKHAQIESPDRRGVVVNPSHPLVKVAADAAQAARTLLVATKAAELATQQYDNYMQRHLPRAEAR